jgi:hypothetical protein
MIAQQSDRADRSPLGLTEQLNIRLLPAARMQSFTSSQTGAIK